MVHVIWHVAEIQNLGIFIKQYNKTSPNENFPSEWFVVLFFLSFVIVFLILLLVQVMPC